MSDNRVIEKITVGSDGVLKFDAKAAGTVVLTVSNPKAGISKSITIVVNGAAALKDFQLGAPSTLIVAGEDVVFPFVAADTFGKEIKGTDLKLDQLELTASNNNLATGYPKVNAKGELVLNFTTEGYNYVTTRVKTPTSVPARCPFKLLKLKR